MSNTDVVRADETFGDYVFSESQSRLFVVGQLPQVLLDDQREGIAVYHIESFDEAVQLATQQNPSVHSATNVLIYELRAQDTPLEQCLGRAIRAFPHRVLLHCTAHAVEDRLDDSVFFAFGFYKLLQVPSTDQPQHHTRWFEYRLTAYKRAPDWLNARFWANPERFDVNEDPDIYCSDDEEE